MSLLEQLLVNLLDLFVEIGGALVELSFKLLLIVIGLEIAVAEWHAIVHHEVCFIAVRIDVEELRVGWLVFLLIIEVVIRLLV